MVTIDHRIVVRSAGLDLTLAVREHPAPARSGSAPPLVVLHGFTGSARTMDVVAEPLAVGRRALGVDLVGHGHSDAPASVAAYRMEACVDQVLAVVGDLTTGPVDLVGYSMGGRVALSLAVTTPDAIRSLVLIGASAGLSDPAEAQARRAADERLATSIETEGLPAFVDRWMGLPMWRSLEAAEGPEGWVGSRRQRLDSDPAGLALSLRGMGTGVQPPVHDQLAALDRPALVLAGELDTKFTAIAHELGAALSQARVEIVPGAGHAAHRERPDLVVGLIADFLDRLDG
ncbi:MAG: 2-succinyl-6-hydroxy-2,4-cyclohexadiene-1-carboxylate synthase [Actinomycetia bacterium]|nr:2-succinyl-6-hydroxy-2,4-cyclohexadiene-1-carboxylate synthase [Actinomycetes bacterium]